MIVCTLVIQWCSTSVSPRQGQEKGTREQVTVTDSSLTNLFRYFYRVCCSSEYLVCMSPCNFRKYFSRILSFFSLGNEGFTLHSLRRGGATYFFRVTGNLSATLEADGCPSPLGVCTSTKGCRFLAHRKIRPATATAMRIAAEALPRKGAFENTVSAHHMHSEMQ